MVAKQGKRIFSRVFLPPNNDLATTNKLAWGPSRCICRFRRRSSPWILRHSQLFHDFLAKRHPRHLAGLWPRSSPDQYEPCKPVTENVWEALSRGSVYSCTCIYSFLFLLCGNQSSQYTSQYVEVIGEVQPDGSINEMVSASFGDSFGKADGWNQRKYVMHRDQRWSTDLEAFLVAFWIDLETYNQLVVKMQQFSTVF